MKEQIDTYKPDIKVCEACEFYDHQLGRCALGENNCDIMPEHRNLI